MKILQLMYAVATASLILISIAEANEIVYTLSGYGQLVTSSTLRWQTTKRSEHFARVDQRVVRSNGKYSSAICRGYFQNTLVPGGTNALNQCAAYFSDKLVLLDDFQVLVDKTLTSRYEWQKWDIFNKLPIGGVAFTETATEATYIATVDSGKICELDPRKGLSGKLSVSQDGKNVEFLEKGYILKEIEPQSYELKNTKYATWRAKVDRTPVHLGSVLLNNRNQLKNDFWDEITSVITYNASYSFYFGQLEGLIRALPAKAETYGGGDKYERVDLSWGLPLKFSRPQIKRVSANLMKGTMVNVSVEARLTTTELPYESALVVNFKDGQVREHNISGTYQETVLANIVVKKGPPHFIYNGTEAPTTTTTTTTTISTVSTTVATTAATKKKWFTKPGTQRPKRTTTPMPTEENPLLRFYPVADDDFEESNEIPPQMMSDQGGFSAKHSERSSPFTESASSGNQILSQKAVIFSIGSGIYTVFIFFLRL